MAKRFLASTGVGVLFGKTDDEMRMVAHVNTLTESTLSISSTQEEVRAGQGAKLYGRFNHDAGLTVTLTDAMFDLNYIAWQVGSELQRGGITMFTEQVTPDAGGVVQLSKKVEKMGESCGFEKALVWYRKAGCKASDKYDSQTVDEGASNFTITGATGSDDYCVSYFTKDDAANTVLVNANFVPAELVLVLTTKLFAGDANNPETGRPVGEITVKIPRFSLDGAFDLSMAMSSAATMSLNGTALAVDDGSCDNEGIYAEIVEVIDGAHWYDGLIGFAPGVEVERDDTATWAQNKYNGKVTDFPVGEEFEVYGLYRNAAPSPVDLSHLTITGITLEDNSNEIETAPVAGTPIVVKAKAAAEDKSNEGMTTEMLAYTLTINLAAGD